MAKDRPVVLKGKTEKIKTECGNLYLTLNEDAEILSEIRIELGKSGHCVNSLLKIIGILISIILQHMERPDIVKTFKKHLQGVGCGNPFMVNGVKYSSCMDRIAKVVLAELKEEADV